MSRIDVGSRAEGAGVQLHAAIILVSFTFSLDKNQFDIIHQVEGQNVTTWSHQKVVQLIRRRRGSPLHLHLEVTATSR